MAITRTRKDKESPHYGFLVSWQPPEARVKRELKPADIHMTTEPAPHKSANNMAQAVTLRNVKKDIVRSLVTIGLVLMLELVVYLAWIGFFK